MENKQAYLIIGQICGLRKAVYEMEQRVEFLTVKSSQSKESPYNDDYEYGEDSSVASALKEAETSLKLIGQKYGAIKCWFNHNHNDLLRQELKTALKVVELGLIGDTEQNLDKLISYLESMANEVLIDWEQLKLTDNFQKAQNQKTVAISTSSFEKNFKVEFMKTHSSKIKELNTYLENHNQKQILKEKMPRKAIDLCEYFIDLKKVLADNKNTLTELKAS